MHLLDKIEELGKEESKNVKRLEDFAKAMKLVEDSVHSRIDKILQVNGIFRAAYHGGDLIGTCILIFMDNAAQIMADVGDLLVKSRNKRCAQTNNGICKVCNNMCTLLTRWGKVLSYAHKEDPVEDNYQNAQNYIDQVFDLRSDMGMSKTVKCHGTEAHLVQQTRRAPGGLKYLDELLMEQYHQIDINLT